MTFEEFRKSCFHTRLKLRIPLLNTYIEKKDLIVDGKYNFEKEEEWLRELYEREQRRLI